jgi:hypothetical protein
LLSISCPIAKCKPLRAALVGSNRCTAAGITATGQAPVLALCRELLAAGFDPDQPLEIYRGTTLALRVRSIGEAARLTVKDNRLGRPVFVRWQDRPASDAAAPPIAPIALQAVP